jgi:hypothetical protein
VAGYPTFARRGFLCSGFWLEKFAKLDFVDRCHHQVFAF